MRVIKLGGSLLQAQTLSRCLDRIEHCYAKNCVIVPGGGLFAEQVRAAQQQWQFDDNTAHAMAILAMQQMALLLNALKPNFALATHLKAIPDLLATSIISPVIWSPDIIELNHAGIAATWAITSDSLAAWLARTLSARQLVLVKSAVIAEQWTLTELIARGIIDPAFTQFMAANTLELSIVNAKNF